LVRFREKCRRRSSFEPSAVIAQQSTLYGYKDDREEIEAALRREKIVVTNNLWVVTQKFRILLRCIVCEKEVNWLRKVKFLECF
jgi:hypothetical protein